MLCWPGGEATRKGAQGASAEAVGSRFPALPSLRCFGGRKDSRFSTGPTVHRDSLVFPTPHPVQRGPQQVISRGYARGGPWGGPVLRMPEPHRPIRMPIPSALIGSIDGLDLRRSRAVPIALLRRGCCSDGLLSLEWQWRGDYRSGADVWADLPPLPRIAGDVTKSFGADRPESRRCCRHRAIPPRSTTSSTD